MKLKYDILILYYYHFKRQILSVLYLQLHFLGCQVSPLEICSKDAIPTPVLYAAIQIIILYTIKNYYLFVATQIGTTILNNILVVIVANKKYPEYICSGTITDAEKKDIKKKVTRTDDIKNMFDYKKFIR